MRSGKALRAYAFAARYVLPAFGMERTYARPSFFRVYSGRMRRATDRSRELDVEIAVEIRHRFETRQAIPSFLDDFGIIEKDKSE